MGTLKPVKTKAVKGGFKSPVDVKLNFAKDDADACPLFLGRYIKNVKNGPSPDWLQKRLKAIGLRPISALVDITNYVSYDLCRPLIFDADKFTAIEVRHAKMASNWQRWMKNHGHPYLPRSLPMTTNAGAWHTVR